MFAIGIDIGGTNTRIGLVSKKGTIVEIKNLATDLSLPPDIFLKMLVHECTPFLNKASAIGMGIAGQVENGFLHFAPNLNWKDVPLGSKLSHLTGLPVVIENDVRASLFGEWICGAGVGYDDIIMLSLGTGIGGAAVSGGKLIRGARSAAGEFGHLCIEIDGLQCSCGSRGCLEAYAGGWAISKQAGGLPAEEVFKKARNGDVASAAIIDKACKALGAGTASLLNAFNPRCVIFTGGIIEGHQELMEIIKTETLKRALKIETDALDWRTGALSNAGVIGSALISVA